MKDGSMWTRAVIIIASPPWFGPSGREAGNMLLLAAQSGGTPIEISIWGVIKET